MRDSSGLLRAGLDGRTTTSGANNFKDVAERTFSVDLAIDYRAILEYGTGTKTGELTTGAATNATSVATLLSNWAVNSTMRALSLVDDGQPPHRQSPLRALTPKA